MTLDTNAIVSLKDAVATLSEQLQELKEIATSRNSKAWFPGIGAVSPGLCPQQRFHAGKSLSVLHNEDGWEPMNAGLVFCPPEKAPLVDQINEQKIRVKEIVRELRESEGSTITTLAGGYKGQNPYVHEALAKLNLPRLNLLWVYRQIHLLPQGIDTVSWLWTRPNAIKRVTIDEAITMAEKLDDPAREYATQVLAGLDPSQNLAYVKPVNEHLRANITWMPRGSKNLRRSMITPTTVMLFQDEKLPRVRWPIRGEKATRLPRRDRKIEYDPIIKSLRLHCYMEGANG